MMARSLIELKAYSRRGDIYRWLRENHERVLHDTVMLERPWGAIAADLASDGVKGMRGSGPYADSVRRIWRRVCRDVEAGAKAAEEAAELTRAKARNYPSRNPKDLRPLVAHPLELHGAARAPPQPLISKEREPWDDPKYTVEQQERIKRQFTKSERHFKWHERKNRPRMSPEEFEDLQKEFDPKQHRIDHPDQYE